MTSLSWKVDKPSDDPDDLPACSSCRKRKLRCSREAPVCYHCSRTGSECVYDTRQKPGLRPGAVEALNRRIAVLEQILLDSEGVPRVTITADGRVVGRNRLPVPDSELDLLGEKEVVRQWDGSRQVGLSKLQNDDVATDALGPTLSKHHENSKRKADQLDGSPSQFSSQETNNLMQGLPPRAVLVKIVDYFCLSFHHWIPFLHKARSQAEVRRRELTADFVLVLHALVAVVLPHLDVEDVQMEVGAVRHQMKTSRDLVMQHAMDNMSLQGLQALVILVFDDLNNGESTRSFPLIALLTRTVDFLQLTVEPGTPRSRVLMKPLNLLAPAQDWTELESRRRLFWCIFLLDRYNSAHTGWNTSLTSEDVHRRLPADGAFFTQEKSVLCPFFGLWNKTFAKLSVSLAAHVPAQYNEDDTPSDIIPEASPPTSASTIAVDSSNLGAFAYCIEATESLNQVTTFFLQQRIDWQNRQDVLDWLTRFKELDLRLVHWKMFLPPRWKDSNISTDKSLVNMDPNLTLAHMTHNTSMILLHYPVAFPPIEWTNLVQLPSACSAETCQLAAVETAHIAEKFLRHTPIPFVNPQFSFCVFVAAKALLALSRATQGQVIAEFSNLVESLWTISARWNRRPNEENYRETCTNQTRWDISGRYAQFLEKLHEKCQGSPEFQFDFLDHSCKNLAHSPRTPVNISTSVMANEACAATSNTSRTARQHSQAKLGRSSTLGRAKRQRRAAERQASDDPTNNISINIQDRSRQKSASDVDYQATSSQPYNSSQQVAPATSHPHSSTTVHGDFSLHHFSPEGTLMSMNNPPVPFPERPSQTYDQAGMQDALSILSDTLMDPQYTELDRVITFEEANFYVSDIGPGWIS
ncbi:uncharacterized protein Z518_03683 [Rhinocladiella mackenziei CBS 650.93]|uniref:Rhinocladiella mackenziei CBS 650.93 unplaced genomic scaffold supercont1.3, whole genome shotgun sequence n=1 Tax=Rhinocladiella mackenziei CBS 650.93 TaxID=1442369 RepID=A0A0D2IRC5_9EURO|nr:uncharacterized protein Z518_03683 [Rhinocladiella mackenziei CBS 650.93]KIX05711.1 hypothetical protein Z518_03683 [Rhinocladiella mackenziei CBS 650.93]